ncbi:hypothetical protein AB0K00_54020 [Dactylosporangium sp. NPDC049525]|uniref:hypothetical protein n=1 Tax=Dactylosporangium sp. NPDC049525 TaxID=3154730 RepID=UPI003429AB36
MPRIDELDPPPAVESHQPVPADGNTNTGPRPATTPVDVAQRCDRCHRVLNDESLCTGCTSCDRCADSIRIVDTTETLTGETVCLSCRASWYWQCGTCDGWNPDGRDCADGCCAPVGCVCDDCLDQLEPDRDTQIYQYSFKPAPQFHGAGPLFLGLELELETPYGDQRSCVTRANRRLGRLGYLKRDESINCGFELVTHPMAYQWAIERFPWTLLTELRELGCRAEDNVGIHVHVSRAGFDSPCHVYRWMKLVYRNESQVTTLARRSSPRWAAFDDDDRRAVKDYAKGAYGRRYTAINTSNVATFELRVFASSVDPGEVQAALAFAAASVEYTRDLTAHDILRGGWSWASFAGWVAAQPQFAPLTQQLEALSCVS